MLENHSSIKVGIIGNLYGDLNIKVENGTPYWCIDCVNGYDWEQIPEYLYEALIKFNKEK